MPIAFDDIGVLPEQQRNAAMELQGCMEGLCQEYACATWLMDASLLLWAFVCGIAEPASFYGGIDAVEVSELQCLHLAAGGWWHAEPEYPPSFFSTEEWLALYEVKHRMMWARTLIRRMQDPKLGGDPAMQYALLMQALQEREQCLQERVAGIEVMLNNVEVWYTSKRSFLGNIAENPNDRHDGAMGALSVAVQKAEESLYASAETFLLQQDTHRIGK
jgi:hypothetical protein